MQYYSYAGILDNLPDETMECLIFNYDSALQNMN